MPAVATGIFDVQLTPQADEESAEGLILSRLALEKQFLGDLEAESRGEMLSAQTATEGSAAYVAIERVRGTLAGRSGTFALQHMGVMDRGAQSLTVAVVPDSGSGELEGLSGEMTISIEDGEHRYEFHYTLPAD